MPDSAESAFRGFYDGIFHFYEYANVFLTFGLIRLWRKKAAKAALLSKPCDCLDLCCGTGEFSRLLVKYSKHKLSLTCLDFNANMLHLAKKALKGKAEFKLSKADDIPFQNNSFDLAAMAFGARNLANEGVLGKTLNEIIRVLRPGGVFLNLETNLPENPFVRFFFTIFNHFVFSVLNIFKPENEKAYKCLKKSIKDFHSRSEFFQLLKNAGFKNISSKGLFFSSALIFRAEKPPAVLP